MNKLEQDYRTVYNALAAIIGSTDRNELQLMRNVAAIAKERFPNEEAAAVSIAGIDAMLAVDPPAPVSTTRNNMNDPTPYAVYCQSACGLVFLSEEEHDRQLSNPHKPWRCPKCGDSADWDDECQATNSEDGGDHEENAT